MVKSRAAVVVVAGGSGSRFGASVNKVYLPLAGRPVVSWSLRSAAQVPEVAGCVLVVRPEDVERAGEVLRREACGLDVRVVVGGATRHASEEAALAHLAPAVQDGEIDVIAVHDAARPLAGPSLFRSAITTAQAVGGAVPVLPAVGVLPVGPDGQPDRTGHSQGTVAHRLARVQTPQAFRADDLLTAYSAAHAAGYQGTDTASSLEAYSDLVVRAVPGRGHNLKVTYPHDLAVAEHLLRVYGYRLP